MLRQREDSRESELRLGQISREGRVRIEFSNSMRFPNTEEFIDLYHQMNNELLELLVLKGDEDIEDENLLGWQIVSVGS